MGKLLQFLVVFVALAGVLYKARLEPILELGGIWRTVEPRGMERCHLVKELEACESKARIYIAVSRRTDFQCRRTHSASPHGTHLCCLFDNCEQAELVACFELFQCHFSLSRRLRRSLGSVDFECSPHRHLGLQLFSRFEPAWHGRRAFLSQPGRTLCLPR
jgi:hypothetical protein